MSESNGCPNPKELETGRTMFWSFFILAILATGFVAVYTSRLSDQGPQPTTNAVR